MVEHVVGKELEDAYKKGNSEEADTVVARYSPKHRTDVIVTRTANLAALL